MEITNLTIRIILLGLPGLICYYIIEKLTEPKKSDYLLKIIEIIVYSFVSYSLLELFSLPFSYKVKFLSCLVNLDTTIVWFEIILSSFISIMLGSILSYLFNNSKFYKMARQLRITKKYGDIDVWAYIFNSEENFYITIRDKEKNMIYQGYPKAFSKEHKEGEMLLQNVNVYNYEDSNFLYNCNSMYYKFNNENINFEITPIKEGEKIEKK